MKFPIDTLAIDRNSVAKWRQEYSLPAAPEELWAFNEEITESFYRLISRHLKTELGELLLIKLKMPKEYGLFLGGQRLLSLLKERGDEPVWSSKAETFEILRSPPATAGEVRIKAASPGFQLLKRKIRNIVYEIRVNGCPCYILNASYDGLPLWNIQPRLESMAYSAKKDSSFRFADQEVILSGAGKCVIPASLEREIIELTEEILGELKSICEKFRVNLDKDLVGFLTKYTIGQLEKAARFRDSITKHLAGRKIHLLAASLSSDFARALALVTHANGGKVTSFNHGNDTFSDRDLRMEMSIADEFCTYTKGSVELLRTRPAHLHPDFSPNRPELSSLDIDTYRNLWEKSQKSPLPEKIRRVMVMGFPFDPVLVTNFGIPDTAFLHLEMKLMESLQKAGFEVLYKEHPESCCPGLPAESLGIRVVTGRLEESAPEADAFVFAYSYSSIFPWTLCLNKPVALIDTMPVHRHHRPEIEELLKRRCALIKVTHDERNCFAYDEAALLSYLQAKPGPPDDVLVKKYMFP
ncbi:MAG: hypothetical protein A2X49_05460 [Lentisphaerae bacterium GWF2_52_8]|nr:MAG: hypothetical protein A2X49_05460 [Lentisphaerae bacterium GWF2_52_8]